MIPSSNYFRRRKSPGLVHPFSNRRASNETFRYLGWNCELTRREVGVTIRREQVSLLIWLSDRSKSLSLTGFSSVNSALQAARKKIEWLEDVRQREASSHRVDDAESSLGPVHWLERSKGFAPIENRKPSPKSNEQSGERR